MSRFLWLGVLWPVLLFALPNVYDDPVREYGAVVHPADTTYGDGRYAALVPGVTDTLVQGGSDTLIRFRPDPDSLGANGLAYIAIRKPAGDSFLVLSYDTLAVAALDSAVVDSIWSAWGLGTPYAYAISVPGAPELFENEPAGFELVTQMRFSDTLNAPTGDWAIQYDSGVAEIVEDITGPYTPDSVGRMSYPAVYVSGVAPGNWYFTNGVFTKQDSLQSDSIYIAYWLKLSDNWIGQASGVNKTFYVSRKNKTSAPIYFSAQGSGANALRYQVRLQGITSQVMDGNQGTNDTIYRGQWHKLEHLFVMNSADGVADGQTRVWIDGVLTHSYDNSEFWENDGNPRYWSGIKWNPVWGGGTSDTIQSDTLYQYVDHVYVSGNDNS